MDFQHFDCSKCKAARLMTNQWRGETRSYIECHMFPPQGSSFYPQPNTPCRYGYDYTMRERNKEKA